MKKGGILKMGAFDTGIYRNVFAEIGKTDEEIQTKLENADRKSVV